MRVVPTEVGMCKSQRGRSAFPLAWISTDHHLPNRPPDRSGLCAGVSH
jgi:hypothetical protein